MPLFGSASSSYSVSTLPLWLQQALRVYLQPDGRGVGVGIGTGVARASFIVPDSSIVRL